MDNIRLNFENLSALDNGNGYFDGDFSKSELAAKLNLLADKNGNIGQDGVKQAVDFIFQGNENIAQIQQTAQNYFFHDGAQYTNANYIADAIIKNIGNGESLNYGEQAANNFVQNISTQSQTDPNIVEQALGSLFNTLVPNAYAGEFDIDPTSPSQQWYNKALFYLKNIDAIAAIQEYFAKSDKEPLDFSNGPEGYAITWEQKFNSGEMLDPKYWNYYTERNSFGFGHNGEVEYDAAARPENTRIENGNLIIEARQEDASKLPGGFDQNYTSARVDTQGKMEFGTNSFIEVRAKLPDGVKGTWAAIWMLGNPITTEYQGKMQTFGHPTLGEIDLADQGYLLHPNEVFAAVINAMHQGDNIVSGTFPLETLTTDFHKFQLWRTPGKLQIFVDGYKVLEHSDIEQQGVHSWPFDRNMYLILNLAMGGKLGGNVDRDALKEKGAKFLIDYIKVYEKDPSIAKKPEKLSQLWDAVVNGVGNIADFIINPAIGEEIINNNISNNQYAFLQDIKPEDINLDNASVIINDAVDRGNETGTSTSTLYNFDTSEAIDFSPNSVPNFAPQYGYAQPNEAKNQSSKHLTLSAPSIEHNSYDNEIVQNLIAASNNTSDIPTLTVMRDILQDMNKK